MQVSIELEAVAGKFLPRSADGRKCGRTEQLVLVQRTMRVQQLDDSLGNNFVGGDVHRARGQRSSIGLAQPSTSMWALCPLARAIRWSAVISGASSTSASAT